MWESGGRTGGRSAIAEFGRRSYNTTWLMSRARKSQDASPIHPHSLRVIYLVKLEFARAKRSGGFRRGALASDSCTVILSDFFETRARAVAI